MLTQLKITAIVIPIKMSFKFSFSNFIISDLYSKYKKRFMVLQINYNYFLK